MKSPEDRSLSLLLGNRIDTVVGRETNIYFEALSPHALTEDWELTVTCDLGRQMRDRWTFVAEPDHVGHHEISISYRSPYNGRLSSSSCRLHVHELPTIDRPLCWLPIGDSITEAGGYIKAVADLSDSSGRSITTLGSRTLRSDSAYRHEGFPGWKFSDFFHKRDSAHANFYESIASPFLFPHADESVFSFTQYLTKHSSCQDPDFITLFLGTNDIALLNEATQQKGIKESMHYAEAFLDEILQATSHAQIGILPPLTPGSQDAFGTNYGCLIPRWRYRKNQQALVQAIQVLFADKHERLSVIPAYLSIDSLPGYPSRTIQPCIHSEHTSTIATNAVHPSESGHRQIGDAIFSWMMSRLS
jgi:lysophospholipase L1-like esterase